jgi:hydrogenase nickel incorporation protein HypB
MCVVCGCGAEADAGQATLERPAADPGQGDLHYGRGAARVSVPGLSQARTVRIEADVLGENDRVADANRRHFAAHGVTAYNLVSSPGSGKTTLLVATLQALRRQPGGRALAVIEGDQQTTHDADRIRATGVPAIQVNTGKGCHLDALMVAEAFARLPLHGQAHDHHDHGSHTAHHAHHANDAHDALGAHDAHDAHEGHHGHHGLGGSHPPHGQRDHAGQPGHRHDPAPLSAPTVGGALLFIENVGNLVCPALWDLGEAAKVVVLSVTEGEDKPLKYPDMFAAAQLMVLSKTDLLPYLDFDVARCVGLARRVNPSIQVLSVSARTGQGMDAWLDWLLRGPARPQARPVVAGQPGAGAGATTEAVADAPRPATAAGPGPQAGVRADGIADATPDASAAARADATADARADATANATAAATGGVIAGVGASVPVDATPAVAAAAAADDTASLRRQVAALQARLQAAGLQP